jgi:hypothetical protein
MFLNRLWLGVNQRGESKKAKVEDEKLAPRLPPLPFTFLLVA